MTEQEPWRILEGQIRECFGRVTYSHKSHEKSADLAIEKQGRIKFLQIVLSAITTTSILAALFGKQQWVLAIAAVISCVLVALNAYTKDYDLGKISQKHKDTANRLWVIRETYLSLLVDLSSDHSDLEAFRTRRDELQSDLAAIYGSAPPTMNKGYARAQQALQKEEELTFRDDEIDAFLPDELHRTPKE